MRVFDEKFVFMEKMGKNYGFCTSTVEIGLTSEEVRNGNKTLCRHGRRASV